MIKHKGKCEHLICLVDHRGNPCNCNMARYCPECDKPNPAHNNCCDGQAVFGRDNHSVECKNKPIEKVFFDKLADVLDEQFPKHMCLERGHALVLNAYANIYLKEALSRQKQVIESREGDSIKLLTKIKHLFYAYQKKPIPTEIQNKFLVKVIKHLDNLNKLKKKLLKNMEGNKSR